jgi:hypothetical protein
MTRAFALVNITIDHIAQFRVGNKSFVSIPVIHAMNKQNTRQTLCGCQLSRYHICDDSGRSTTCEKCLAHERSEEKE